MNFRRDSFILEHGANESTFSHDGRIPNTSDAERHFNFNESRLSFGFSRPGQRTPLTSGGPQSEVMYETLSHYRPSQSSNQWTRRDPPPPLPKKSTPSGSATTQTSQNTTSTTTKNMQMKKEWVSISLWIKFIQQSNQLIDVDVLHDGLLECFHATDKTIVVYTNPGNKKLRIPNLLETPEEHHKLFNHHTYSNKTPNFATITHKIESALTLPSLLHHEKVKDYLAGNNITVKK